MEPTSTPLPPAIPKPQQKQPKSSTSQTKPIPITTPKPKFRLQLNDLRHPASKSFLSLIPDPLSNLETALNAIIQHLYTTNPGKTTFAPSIPPTRSVTVILRDLGGIAYTTGTELDDDHKEIHFSLSYVNVCTGKADPVAEIVGVLTHELVHCYQHTAPPASAGGDSIPRPPGGLIEGIADFVRLKAGLAPPHWRKPTSSKDRADKWDQGYEHTAFFLAWIEDVRVGKGAVGLLNDRLLRVGYIGETGEDVRNGKDGFWRGLFGKGVLELWEDYGNYLDSLAK